MMLCQGGEGGQRNGLPAISNFSVGLNPYLLRHGIYSAFITYLVTGVVLNANDRWLRLQTSLFENLKGVYNGVNCRVQCCILD